MSNLRERITYNIEDNGYTINLDGRPWIVQDITNMPYPNLSIEECCKAQIDELCAEQRKQEEMSLQEQITNLELAIVELYEAQQGGAE